MLYTDSEESHGSGISEMVPETAVNNKHELYRWCVFGFKFRLEHLFMQLFRINFLFFFFASLKKISVIFKKANDSDLLPTSITGRGTYSIIYQAPNKNKQSLNIFSITIKKETAPFYYSQKRERAPQPLLTYDSDS